MSEEVKLSDAMLLALQLALQFAPQDNTQALFEMAVEMDGAAFLKGEQEAVGRFLRVIQDGISFGRWP